MSELKYTNLSYLKEVSGEDPEFMKEMINIFISQIPEFIENMENHFKEGNYIDLGKEAHKAKSSVIIMGMEELGIKMKELQLLTEKNENIETYQNYISEFKNQCQGAIEELTTFINSL